MTKVQSRLVLIGLLLGVLLEALDGTIVGTAMPKVVADLNGINLLSWVFSAYIITQTVTTPLWGKLSDRYGRLPFFLAGMFIFMAGSAACGLVQDMPSLVIWRGVQGIGAGAMLPVALALALTIFPENQKSAIQGGLSAAYGLAAVVGPTAGGVIADNWGWRWVFYVNLPVGIFAGLLLWFFVPASGRRNDPTMRIHKPLDYAGAATLSLFSAALMLALVWGGDETIGWTGALTIGAFVVSVLGLAAFIFVEGRAADPIVPLSSFRNRTFTFMIISIFMMGGSLYAVVTYLPLFVQSVLGASATESGAITTPLMIAVVVGSGAAGFLVGSRIKSYKPVAIFASVLLVIAVGLMATLGKDSSQLLVVLYMIIFGLGIGITFPLYNLVAANSMEKSYLGVALSLITFFRSMGGAISVAILGSVFSAKLGDQTPHIRESITAALPPGAAAQMPPGALDGVIKNGAGVLSNTQGLAQLHKSFGPAADTIITILRSALADAINVTFIAAAIITALALLATFGLKNEKLTTTLTAAEISAMEHAIDKAPAPEPVKVG